MTPDALREFRKSLRLSQSEFARILGVSSDRTVRRWEEGERDIPGPVAVIVDIAKNFPAVAKWLAR